MYDLNMKSLPQAQMFNDLVPQILMLLWEVVETSEARNMMDEVDD